MTDSDSLKHRVRLNSEWHARPVATMPSPFRCTHMVFARKGRPRVSRELFARLCDKHGQAHPAEGSRQHKVQLGSALVKWEGHTDADSVTALVPGNATPLFSEPAFAYAPSELRDIFEGDIICGVQIEVIKQRREDMDLNAVRAVLGATDLYGGPIADGNASLWTGFRLDADGFSRMVMVDHALPDGAEGRYLQRIVETESYRLQAMAALPVARETMGDLSRIEEELEPLMDRLGSAHDGEHETLLTQLSLMAARIEHLAAASSYRFAAARAYSGIVEQRLKELREERVLTQPRYSVFLRRTLQPAMRTCEAAERRIDELAQRVSRALTLLNSMVDMIQTRQSNSIMQAMSRNAEIQVRLQQAVEGFSTFVISYYALGILGYVLEGVKELGVLPVAPKVIVGASAPLVLLVVWAMSRRMRKKLTSDTDTAKQNN